MLVLVIVLVVTNVATLAGLFYLFLQPIDLAGPDAAAAAALDRSPRPPTVVGARRLISIEILNPIELAGTKGRLAGIAGSLVPGLTRRIVYDQTLKILKQQLEGQRVVADVRLHTLRPLDGTTRPAVAEPVAAEPASASAEPMVYTDEVEQVDLDRLGEQPERADRPPSP